MLKAVERSLSLLTVTTEWKCHVDTNDISSLRLEKVFFLVLVHIRVLSIILLKVLFIT